MPQPSHCRISSLMTMMMTGTKRKKHVSFHLNFYSYDFLTFSFSKSNSCSFIYFIKNNCFLWQRKTSTIKCGWEDFTPLFLSFSLVTSPSKIIREQSLFWSFLSRWSRALLETQEYNNSEIRRC